MKAEGTVLVQTIAAYFLSPVHSAISVRINTIVHTFGLSDNLSGKVVI